MSNFITKEFEPRSAAAWKQKIQVDLKGADYNETLLTHTNEGLTIKPFYHLDNFEKLNIPSWGNGFKICQHIIVNDAVESNKQALNAIDKGATALKFKLSGVVDWNHLLNGLLNQNIEFHFDFDLLDLDFIESLLITTSGETTFINLDIIGKLASTGNWYQSADSDFAALEKLISRYPNHFIVGIDAAHYLNAGANSVQQIAYALAHINEYLTRFQDEQPIHGIQINVAIGNNYFFEIAKLRAFRYLLELIAGEYTNKLTYKLYAAPATRNKTLYDYNVNMLRTTTECMAAILGGANTISNTPYDHSFKNTNDFGERIARNQLHILKEESYLNGEEDIVENTYYIEAITTQLAEKALSLFKDIEKSGGFIKQLFEGTIQRKLRENATKEQEQFDNGTLVLLGTNKYPNDLDQMKNTIEKDPFVQKRHEKTLITPIIARRLSESLEQKRLEDET